ncbi:hypothetical protein CMI37_39340 [Candidatus Pacearchaeota archaeon]|nr:hypothetical protein [Candidatus Pacearchaeota archaeon]|tara:strand:+ start:3079 stop:3456 length:378 start_codon:yes stop_codon:yes gene_type:complete
MKNRKSQAALEFIMTYGWAFLVVFVAIGALAYFGVLSPDRFLPEEEKCESSWKVVWRENKYNCAQLKEAIELNFNLAEDVRKKKTITCVNRKTGIETTNSTKIIQHLGINEKERYIKNCLPKVGK